MSIELDPEKVLASPSVPSQSQPRGLFDRWVHAREVNPSVAGMLLVGVIVPVVLFALDRKVVPSGIGLDGAAPFRPYSTLMMAACVAALIGWLLIRAARMGRCRACGPLLPEVLRPREGLLSATLVPRDHVRRNRLSGSLRSSPHRVLPRGGRGLRVERRRLDAGPVVSMSVSRRSSWAWAGRTGQGSRPSRRRLRGARRAPRRSRAGGGPTAPTSPHGPRRASASGERRFELTTSRSAALAYERITGRPVAMSD